MEGPVGTGECELLVKVGGYVTPSLKDRVHSLNKLMTPTLLLAPSASKSIQQAQHYDKEGHWQDSVPSSSKLESKVWTDVFGSGQLRYSYNGCPPSRRPCCSLQFWRKQLGLTVLTIDVQGTMNASDAHS